MFKRFCIFSIVAFVLIFVFMQSSALSAPSAPLGALILFTPSDAAASPDDQTIFLTDNQNNQLVAADLETGEFQILNLPYSPTKISIINHLLLTALSTPDYGSDAIAIVDPASFTVSSTIAVNIDILGITADANYIYAYSNNTICVYDYSGNFLSSVMISNLYDLECNPVDGNLYSAQNNATSCLNITDGVISLVKTNSKYGATQISIMPDGKSLVLSSGYVLTCASDANEALNYKTKLPASNTTSADVGNGELYVAVDRLIQVYDSATLNPIRVIPQKSKTEYLLFSAGRLITAQRDSTNNLVFSATDPGALLKSMKINGDAISELYPLQFNIDDIMVSNATASVDVSAIPAMVGGEVSGDVGLMPLAVGNNKLSIAVKNPSTGITQTYTVVINRAAKDFPATEYNGFGDLGFIPEDFALDPDRPVAYLTAADGYSLFRLDLQTGGITEKLFTLPAERLTVKNGKVYVTLLRTGHVYSASNKGYGAVAVVDTGTFQTDAIFNTNIDPFDIEADEDGNIYLAPGSNQWSYLASYDGNTGVSLSATSLYYRSYIEGNPVSGKLYSVTSNVSPSDITAYEISSGIITKAYDSIYHGDYNMSAYIKVSPDGKYIFNGSGCIFTSAPEQAGDMNYDGTLNTAFTSMCFDLSSNTFYVANGKTIFAYYYDSRELKDFYTVSDDIISICFRNEKITLLQKSSSLKYYVRNLSIRDLDVDLSSIRTSAGTLSPAFDKDTLEYNLILLADNAAVSIEPIPADDNSMITIDGEKVQSKTISLNEGACATVKIGVEALDKSVKQEYTVRVYRQTNDHTFATNPSFLTPTAQVSANGVVYMIGTDKSFLYKFDGATGGVTVLPLPGIPEQLGYGGNTLLLTMYNTKTNTRSVGVVDTDTFALSDVFNVDTSFTGIRGDKTIIYAFSSSVIKAYSRTDHSLVFSKAINSILDVQPNEENGLLYVANDKISSYRIKDGQLTLVKSNTNCPGSSFAIMPDGMHLLLKNGTVMRCSNNAAYDLVPETTLSNVDGFVVDQLTNEIYCDGTYVINVFDASTFSFKRSWGDPSPTQFMLGSVGNLYLAQKNSQENLQFRWAYSDTMLQSVKCNGDVIDGLYPMRPMVETGEVPASQTGVDIAAVAALPGCVVAGDIGHQPLSVGKNEFIVTVTNPASGHSQAYNITVIKRAGNALSNDGRLNLGFTPLDVVLDPDRAVEYLTAENGKSLYRVDLATGQITEKAFSVRAERIAIHNGNLYLTLLRTGHLYYGNNDGFGAVAVIDTATFTTKALFSTDVDPFDIEVDSKGNFFLAPGSAQWSVVVSYNGNTGALLSFAERFFCECYVERNPASDKIYLITTVLSPRDITAVEISNGLITKYYGSPYHGDYDMSTYMKIDPQGKFIFNGAGTIFVSKSAQTGDMQYWGTLGKPFTAICFDKDSDRFYIGNERMLTAFEYSTQKALYTLTLDDTIVNLQYDGNEIAAILKSSDGRYYTCGISPVFVPVTGITLNVSNTTIYVGSTKQILASIQPNNASDKMVAWSSGNSKIATVNNGLVTGVSPGTVTIRAMTRDGNFVGQCSVTVKQVTVSFNSQGGSSVSVVKTAYGAKIASPSMPAKAGYSFAGWYKEVACTNAWDFAADPVTGDVTLYAKWTVNSYTVSFNSQGGSDVTSKKAPFGSTISEPISPTRSGYTFAGWYKEAATTNAWVFSTDTMPAQNITLYAKWAANKYAVTFDSQGGSAVPGIEVEYNAKITAPKPPTKNGFGFGGWYMEPACINAWEFGTNTMPAHDITLYARWSNTQHTVSFITQGGTSVAPMTVNFGALISAPTPPTRTGYFFQGWYKESSCATAWNFSTDSVTADITLYAKWASTTPTGVVAASASYSSVKVSWKTVPGASGYQVYRSASSTGTYALVATVTGTSFINTGLTTGTAYYYKVRSYRGTVYSSYSAVVSARPVPTAPASPRAAAVTYNSIKVTWAAVSGATKYEVYRATSSTGTYALLTTTSYLYYTNGSVNTGTTYYYKVRAYRLVGSTKRYGAFSSVVSAKTSMGTPGSFKAAPATYSSIKVTWSAVTGASGYVVYRATSSTGSYTSVGTATSTSFTNTNIGTGITYYYKVRAYRTVGGTKVYGPYSASATAKTSMSYPTTARAARASSTSIKVTWSAVSGATRYEVWHSTSSGGTYTLVATTASLYYTNGSLTTGKTYYYKVRAYHLEGSTKVYGPWSKVVYAKP